MFEELVHSVLEQWSHVAETFFHGIQAPKILSVLIPIVPAAYGVFIKWRSSGYRLLDRIEEFLGRQEKRLEESRESVASLFRCPSPARSLDEPTFDARAVSRSLRKMDWGFGAAAVNDLHGAIAISSNQVLLAQKQMEEFRRRQALAHLLLGAKHASRNIQDPEERRASREAALEHFNAAIEIDPNDVDAIEYAGMMLLELANPAGALERFNQLISLRLAAGGTPLARAYRLQATAFETLPAPSNANANAALGNALAALPPSEALERALTFEHRGNVRLKLGFGPAANTCFQNALTIYQGFRSTPAGREGLERVNAAIAKINRSQNASAADGATQPQEPPPTVGPSNNWIAKLARPNG